MKKRDKEVEKLDLADNLTKNIAKLRKKIEAIENEGEVAEPGYTLMRYLAGGRKKGYWYYKLQARYPIFPTKSGKLSKYKHLGKGGSKAHIEALMQISRRNQIDALSRTLDSLVQSLSDLVKKPDKNKKSE